MRGRGRDRPEPGLRLRPGFGWKWSKAARPCDDARFSLVYTVVLAAAALIALGGVDPLRLTLVAMALTVILMPLIGGRRLVVAAIESGLPTLARRGSGYVVTEYHVGPEALLERLALDFQSFFRKPPRKGCAIAWDQIELSDPGRPRLTCPVDQLHELGPEDEQREPGAGEPERRSPKGGG